MVQLPESNSEGKKAYMVFAGIVSLVFTVIVFLALTGFWGITPTFGAGYDQAVITTVWSVGAVVIAAKIHEWVQRGLSVRRVSNVSKYLCYFDIATSFLPAFVAFVTLVIQQWYYSSSGLARAPWWFWVQMLDGAIIAAAFIEDFVPTIRHIAAGKSVEPENDNHSHASANDQHGAPDAAH